VLCLLRQYRFTHRPVAYDCLWGLIVEGGPETPDQQQYCSLLGGAAVRPPRALALSSGAADGVSRKNVG
jgi:hypothetical protein